jgi:hypothetical protein
MSFACAPNPGRVVLDVRFSANAQEQTINIGALPGYIGMMTDVNVTVDPGVYLWSNNVGVPALTITGGTGYDRVRLVNKGYILGKGGNGGSVDSVSAAAPQAGGHALQHLVSQLEIDNAAGYIAGGGGGGAGVVSANGSGNKAYAAGGGGAGGGNGGAASVSGTWSGGAGSTGLGSGGSGASTGTANVSTGGGGGRILPANDTNGNSVDGTTATGVGGPGGQGGGAGGVAANFLSGGWGAAAGGGGGWGQPGGSSIYSQSGTVTGGKGGGMSAGGSGANTGGSSVTVAGAGGAAGKAINLVSGTRTIVSGASRMYGATA